MLEKIKIFFREYRLMFFLSAILGLLVILPTILSIYQIGFDNFRGIYPTFNDDENHYLAMARDVLDGYRNVGNVFIEEYKSSPWIQPSLAANIFVLFSRIFNVSIPFIFFINDFILTFIGSILLFFLFYDITKEKRLSVIFSVVFYLLFLFSFGRPINPQFSFIFLVTGLILIWRVFENINADKFVARYPVFLGINIAILVYIYPYFWTALFVLYSLIIFWGIIKMKKISIINNFFLTLFSVGVICVPYFINLSKAVTSPFYRETMERMGMLNTHWPACYINVSLLFFALLIIFLLRKKIEPQKYIFSVALILSGVLLNWQNVITGKYLQFSSHYYQVSIFFIFIVVSIIALPLLNNFKKINLKEIVSIFLLIFLIIFIFYRQINELNIGISERSNKEQMLKLQSYRPVFDWLDVNTAKDSVVLTLDSDIEPLVPVYTHNNLYSYGYSAAYLLSDEEMEDRWIRKNIFKKEISADNIKDDYRAIWFNKFIDKYQNQAVRNKIIKILTNRKIEEPVLLPDIYINRVLDKYNEVKKEDVGIAFKKYRIDYILIDQNNELSGILDSRIKDSGFASLVANISNFVIYQIKQ